MATIREMTMADYAAAMAVLRGTAGIRLRDADSLAATERYMERNPGFSFVAQVSDEVIGCIMSGHDGRRGYLQHLAVLPAYRRQGVGKALASRCLYRLASIGILKCHVDVIISNHSAVEFWSKQGWTKRDDICRFSYIASGGGKVQLWLVRTGSAVPQLQFVARWASFVNY